MLLRRDTTEASSTARSLRGGGSDDPAYGVPFVGSSSMLMADLSHLPMLRREDAESAKTLLSAASAGNDSHFVLGDHRQDGSTRDPTWMVYGHRSTS